MLVAERNTLNPQPVQPLNLQSLALAFHHDLLEPRRHVQALTASGLQLNPKP